MQPTTPPQARPNPRKEDTGVPGGPERQPVCWKAMGFLEADEGSNPPTPPPRLCFRNTPSVFLGANRYSSTCICGHADVFFPRRKAAHLSPHIDAMQVREVETNALLRRSSLGMMQVKFLSNFASPEATI
ncbi:hypothetical protein CSIM01_13321 [Colletotrichum simmondsii]|uniref:Uncharacterized protein n=1 Tax=Colletotrichum simmondsii TaxID=703756 RepID=A0A135TYG6_9PEZI|nr:hypothetical protein CSIM01_13321 [Colletotrichum simmondsii]